MMLVCLVFMLVGFTWWHTSAAVSLSIARTATVTDFANASVTIAFSGAVPTSGKLLLIIAAGNAGSVSVSGGSGGWTELDSGASGSQCFYRIAGGSEPSSYTITYGGAAKTDNLAAIALEVAGANASPIDAHAATASSHTNPAVTTTAANDLVILLAADATGSGATYNTPPSGYSTVLRTFTGTGASDVGVAVASKSVAAIGSTSPGAWDTGSGKVFTVAVKS